MSDAKGQQHEPSMEEILASIRRIIAEDGDTTAPAAEAAEAAAVVAAVPAPANAAPFDDILELTDVVEPDGSVVSLNAAPAKAAPAPPPPPVREVAPAAPAGEGIVSAATAAASV